MIVKTLLLFHDRVAVSTETTNRGHPLVEGATMRESFGDRSWGGVRIRVPSTKRVVTVGLLGRRAPWRLRTYWLRLRGWWDGPGRPGTVMGADPNHWSHWGTGDGTWSREYPTSRLPDDDTYI